MRKLLVLIFIFSVLVLGCGVYQDNQMKKRQQIDQAIQEAHLSLKVVNSNPNNAASDSVDPADPHSSKL